MMNDKDAPRNNSEDNYDLTDFLVTYYGEDMEPYESDSPGRWIEAADAGHPHAGGLLKDLRREDEDI